MRSVSESFCTNGDGFWSVESIAVQVVGLDVAYIADDGKFGELRVYFDMESWNTSEHGLIYTDKGFLAELKDYLTRAGYAAEGVAYSEEGMQGDNFVSFDVDAKFLQSWSKVK